MHQSLQLWTFAILLEITLTFSSSLRSFGTTAIIRKWPIEKNEVPSGYIPLSYSSNHNPLLWNKNCYGSSLFVHNGLLYLGTDIKGLHSLVTPERVLKGSSVVMSVAFTPSYLLAVIEGRLLILDLINSNLVLPAKGIDGNVTNVVSFQCCYSDREWCQQKSKVVVAYNEKQESTSQVVYYLSYDGGLQFNVHEMAASYQGHIYGATLLHSHSEIAFLVKTTSTTARFIHTSYNSYHKRSSAESLEFDVEGDADLGFIQLQNGIDSLLVWDSTKLLYSISSGQAVLPVDVFTSSGSLSSTPLDNQQVVQVVADEQRSFAVLTDGNRIFFGRESMLPQAVELDVSVPGNGSCQLQWVDSVHLTIMCPADEQSFSSVMDVSSTTIHIEQHLGLLTTTSRCPHQAFNGDFNNEVFYLDIDMDVNISATFIPEKWRQNWFMVGVSNPDIIYVQSNTKEEEMLATGLSNISVNAHIDLVASSLPNGHKEIARGTSALWMAAMNTSLVCPHNPFLVAQIAAECPPYKNIRVRNVEESCEEMKGYSYVIKKENYDSSFLSGLGDPSNQEDLTISYDYAELGCPVKDYYGDLFKPKLDLYHGDTFVEEVLVDYVLYEIHGVFTYGYTKTAAQVDCVSASQSWTAMLMQQDAPDPSTAWTRNNYRSCFLNGSELSEPHQSYEVLSNASTNAIHWDDYNTIYVFQVTVVDPDYSFCHLSTQFAVQVYGALPKAATQPLRIMFSTCGVGLSVLAAGFIVHKVWGEKTEEEQDKKDR